MRAKSILLLVLALGCGLVASIGITQVMATRDASATGAVETETILVAMKDVPMGDPLTAQMVKLEAWPKDKIPSGAMRNLEDVEGRRPKAPIPAGMAILDQQLLGRGAEQGASGIIPTGLRVAPVKVDPQIGNASMIRPSDRVDVLVYVKQDPGRGVLRTMTRTILQDIKVFAVNDQYDVAATSSDKSITAKTIWLLVTPEQAEDLTLAGELGQLRLVMRSPGDKEQRKLEGRDPRKTFEGMIASTPETPEPAPLPKLKEPKEAKGAGNRLLDLLGAAKNEEKEEKKEEKKEPKPALADANSSWTIRILAGAQVCDTVLESQGTATEPGEGKPDRWKVAATSEWSTATPPAGEPAARAHARPAKEQPVTAEGSEKGSTKKADRKTANDKTTGKN